MTININRGLFTLSDDGQYQVACADTVIAAAKAHLEARVCRGLMLTSPAMVKDYLVLQFAKLEHEVFSVLFLDAQTAVIEYREMFRGTLTQTSVFPREIVKAALSLNAASVIFAHNHPSGSTAPSRADEYLTQTLRTALNLIDVRVLDHMVVGASRVASFAELGFL